MVMRIDVVSLFPDACDAWCDTSIVGRARRRKLVELSCHDPRRFAGGRHRVVDHRPFGGGPGMVLAAPPMRELPRSLSAATPNHRGCSCQHPQGKRLDQACWPIGRNHRI